MTSTPHDAYMGCNIIDVSMSPRRRGIYRFMIRNRTHESLGFWDHWIECDFRNFWCWAIDDFYCFFTTTDMNRSSSYGETAESIPFLSMRTKQITFRFRFWLHTSWTSLICLQIDIEFRYETWIPISQNSLITTISNPLYSSGLAFGRSRQGTKSRHSAYTCSPRKERIVRIQDMRIARVPSVIPIRPAMKSPHFFFLNH